MKTVTSTWGIDPGATEPADGTPQARPNPWASPPRWDLPVAGATPPELTPAPALEPPAPMAPPAPTIAPAAWPERESVLDGWLTVPVPRRRMPTVGVPGAARPRPRKPPRRSAGSLAALVCLSLLAAFFAWVSAEPLWLAVGHGDRGTATITRCAGTGVGQRCQGEFTAANGEFTVDGIAMLGLSTPDRIAGASVNARMVSSDSRGAYAAGRSALHLRWIIGLLLIVACGLGIVVATGALRHTDRRSRLGAVGTSLAAPLLITIGFLAATF